MRGKHLLSFKTHSSLARRDIEPKARPFTGDELKVVAGPGRKLPSERLGMRITFGCGDKEVSLVNKLKAGRAEVVPSRADLAVVPSAFLVNRNHQGLSGEVTNT